MDVPESCIDWLCGQNHCPQQREFARRCFKLGVSWERGNIANFVRDHCRIEVHDEPISKQQFAEITKKFVAFVATCIGEGKHHEFLPRETTFSEQP